MLFREQSSHVSLAISQLTHAWISGQILRAWNENLGETVLLAAEQHDVGWMDWETAPSFNPQTGRPHLFRDIGASVHAPMWIEGVQRALNAWGSHVALLISRHGGVIYRRYVDRHRISEADATAAQRFLDTQAPIEASQRQKRQSGAPRIRTQDRREDLAATSSFRRPECSGPGSSKMLLLALRSDPVVVAGERGGVGLAGLIAAARAIRACSPQDMPVN